MKQNGFSTPLGDEVQPIAAASLLTVRYPAALDTPPSVLNDTTPLTGVVMNYLALMLEAIQAEIGPAQGILAHHNHLLRFLGYELNNRVSNWRSFSKAFGGNEAGQVFGIMKRYHSFTGAAFDVVRNGTATSNQGIHPLNKQPVVFGEATRTGGSSTAAIAISVGGGVRGRAIWTGAASISYDYRGHPALPNPVGACQGAHTQGVNLLILFPFEAFQ